MASNPLFQRSFRKEVFLAKPLSLQNDRWERPMNRQVPGPSGRGEGNGRSDGSRKRETGFKQEPQTKRRRLEEVAGENDDGDWDDSIELTQQDLQTLDVIASQAVMEPASASQGAGPAHVDPNQTLPLAADVSTQEQQLFQRPGVPYALKAKSSSSSNSDVSVFPTSSTSLSKTSSTESSSAAGSLTASTADSSHSSGSLSTSASVREELNKKIEQIQRLTAELGRARDQLYARDGQVSFLQESLHRQETELEKLREDREARQEREQEKQKERERELKAENERLQTQIQFLRQDVTQMKDRLQEQRAQQPQAQVSPAVASTSSNTSASTPLATSTPGSPQKSPRKRKVLARAGGSSRTPEKGVFPSRQSFMAGPGDSSSREASTAAPQKEDAGTMTTEAEGVPLPVPQSAGAQRRLRLNVPHSKGQMTGAQVVSQLLESSVTSDGEVNNSGLMDLVQMLPSRLDLTGLRYERDSTTSRLSPVKKLRSGEFQRQSLASASQHTQSRPIVSRENFLLAVQGLRNLLESSQHEQTLSVNSNSSASAQGPQDTGLNGSLFLLPLLNDYMSHYIDIFSSSANNSAAAVSSPNLMMSDSSKSSSIENSLESLTSSLGMLLQEGADYVNSIETLALCTLRVLHKLVCMCAQVRSVFLTSRLTVSFLYPSTDTSSSSMETGQDKTASTSGSGVEGDDEQSTTSSSDFSTLLFSPEHTGSPTTRLQGLNILHKVVRLASPSHEGSGYNPLIVQEALRVLTALALKADNTQMDRLNLVILRGVVAECLNLEQQHAITVSALKLFAQLIRSPSVVMYLCTKSESCTLLHVHMAAIRHLRNPRSVTTVQSLAIIDQVISSLLTLVRHHRVTVLTDNNCKCSGQVVPSLVHAMSHLLQEFQISQDSNILATLRRGVLLLYDLSVWDSRFQVHCGVVEIYFTDLMTALSRIYKTIPDLPSSEVFAMDELWGDDEDSDSQGSDQEEAMDAN